MKKEKQITSDEFAKLRKLVNDGFKEYDGDIREETLEILQDIDAMYKTSIDANEILHTQIDNILEAKDAMAAEVVSLTNANKILTTQLDELLKVGDVIYKGCNEMGKIDFGIGMLYYAIKKEGSITVKELIQAIRDAAMVEPLPEMINAIKKLDRKSTRLNSSHSQTS